MKNLFLKKIIEIPGISGREEKISKHIEEILVSYDLDIVRDNNGSIYGYKKSEQKNAPVVMVDAHMDEVGFIVTKIEDNGILRLEAMGGISKFSIANSRLRVWSDNPTKSFAGTLFFKEPQTDVQKKQPIPAIKDMMFDIGAVDKKQVQKEFELNIGNVVTFDYPSEQNGDRVIAKSLDDRAGVAILLETLDFIKNTSFDYDIYIGASSQEEVGLRGARTSAYKINPDLAIVVDVSPSNDLPTDEQTGTLGKGTILRHKDSCYLTDKYIIKYIRDLSTKHNIKIQDYFGTGCTNAGILHLSNNGIKTIPLGLLARGLHTGSSIIDMNDYEETKKLLKEVLTDLNIKTINKIKGNT